MPSQRIAHFGTTIFARMTRLANELGAVNLGQGFPDFDGPQAIKDVAAEAMARGENQYAMSPGVPALREAICQHAARFYGQTLDPQAQVTVTQGCTEAIFDAVMAFVDPGDEVVLFEPWYDSYLASVELAGGVPRYVRLQPPDGRHTTWWFDEAELSRAFSDKTRLVFLNTPHNPTGKVFTEDEIDAIGALAKRHGAVVVSDEVYEHLVFAPARHVRTATRPGLAERTLTLSSGGKSFSFTGWKVGWALGPAELVAAVQKVHQWVTFATPAPFQHAIAAALRLDDGYFEAFARDYRRRRDVLSEALAGAGFEPLAVEGSYFIIARTGALRRAGETDVDFCLRLVEQGKVAAIPPSVFYSAAHADQAFGLARFAFCKSDAALTQARQRLAALTPG